MAEFQMWGPQQSGPRLAELDNVKNRLDNMRALQLAGEVEKQPYEIQALQATSRLNSAKAGEAEFTLAATKKWSEAMSRAGDGQDALAVMETAGLEAMRAGLPKLGGDLINRVSQARLRSDQQLSALATAARQESLAARDRATLIGNLAATVVDQPSLDRAGIIAQSQGLDVSEMPKVFNEQTAPFFRQLAEGAIGAAKRAELQLREIDIEGRNASRDSRIQNDSATRELREVQRRLAEARIRKIDREGGGVGGTVGSPTKADVARAKTLLKDSGLDLGADDLKLASDAVAARAKAMVKANRGLDIEQATRLAIAKAKEEGDFPANANALPLIGNKHKFSGAGKTPQIPLEVPLKGDKPDTSKLIEGKFYKTPKGVFRRVGNGWEQAAQGLVGPLALNEADNDEDEDDA